MLWENCYSSKVMFLWLYLEIVVNFEGTCGINVYITPASDMEFDNFELTNKVPTNGSEIGGELQERVQIEGSHVIFQFKGLGNAHILFRRESVDGPKSDVFLVEIGGGTSYSEVRIYDPFEKDDPLSERTIPNITSVTEYRYFWILWIAHEMRIHVGTGNTLYENEIISANRTVLQSHHIYLNQIIAVAISTTSSNIGYWRFNIPAIVSAAVTSMSSSTEEKQATFSQTRTSSLAVSTTNATTMPLTNQAAASKTEQVPTNGTILTSTLTSTKQGTELSGNLSAFTSSIYMTMSTYRNTDVSHKRFLDKLVNVAVIGFLSSAAGVGAVCMAGYLMKKWCTKVSVASGRVADEEESK